MALITNLVILNGSDKTRHYSVCAGNGAVAEVLDPIVTDINKYPKGSSYLDLTNKTFYQRVATAKATADWEVVGTSGSEVTTNKVTSISSGSTNDQYPSAKLLYDQLLLKGNFASSEPASATAAGTAGQMFISATHVYKCTATNTWIRAALALATW